MWKGRTALIVATAALACAPVAGAARDPEVLPFLLVPGFSAPPDDSPARMAIPLLDSAPLPGDRPTLAPAAGAEVLDAAVFAAPAPPVVREQPLAASRPPRPRSSPGQATQARPSAVRTARQPAATQTTPRREAVEARTRPESGETTRRIQPGWLLGVYR
jgi:hypothetical protein